MKGKEKKSSDQTRDSLVDGKRPRVPSPEKWSSTMDELIEQAMREGAFDNLPGKGKPLNLARNPLSPDTDLAYQLLRDNNYTLPWIVERKKAMARIQSFRDEIGRTWHRFQAEYRVAASDLIRLSLSLGWHDQLESWQDELKEINRLIGEVNLKQPADGLEIVKLGLSDELERAGAQNELG